MNCPEQKMKVTGKGKIRGGWARPNATGKFTSFNFFSSTGIQTEANSFLRVS
jgi:hypothetical protein